MDIKPTRLILIGSLAAAGVLDAEEPVTGRASDSATEAFQLGTLTVYGEKPSPSDNLESSITAATIELLDKKNVADALAVTPGVTFSRVGGRNEAVVFVRGFDRLQTPIYIDGVPAYVPYDGYVDLGRFTTYDLASIQVAKGYSSVLYGPNAMGGAINLVSRSPSRPLEGKIRGGVFTGNGHEASLNIGSRQEKWYFQLGASYLEQDYFELPGDWEPVAGNANENGGRRENSDSRDRKFSGKIAYTPTADDEYAFGFSHQEGEKGHPLYTGTASAGMINRFWRWPEWDKDTFYFVGNTRIGDSSYIKPRFYHDTYNTSLDPYTDATFSTLLTGARGPSSYDDYSWGGSIEAGTELLPRQTLKGAIHYKLDHHSEQIVTFPESDFEDQTFSIGIEDTFHLSSQWDIQGGLAYDWRDSKEAFDSNTNAPFSSTDFDSFNPQAGVFHKPDDLNEYHLTIARKSRFPSVKERYSYRFGTAIPNPDLDAESAIHYELGYVGQPVENLSVRFAVFYSDIEETIQNVRIDPATFQNQNVGESEIKGIETGLDYTISKYLTVGGGYTWVDRKNVSSPSVTLTDVPEHSGNLHADIRPVDWFAITPSLEASSWRYFDTTGGRLPGFAVANLACRFELPRDVTLGLGVKNLFDKEYAVSEGYPEPGRSYYANLNWNF